MSVIDGNFNLMPFIRSKNQWFDDSGKLAISSVGLERAAVNLGRLAAEASCLALWGVGHVLLTNTSVNELERALSFPVSGVIPVIAISKIEKLMSEIDKKIPLDPNS